MATDEITALRSEGKQDLRAEAKARQLIAEALATTHQVTKLLERLLEVSDREVELADDLPIIQSMSHQIDDGRISLRVIMATALRCARRKERPRQLSH